MIKSFGIIFLSLLFTLNVSSQIQLPQFIPNSPEAAVFLKHNETPVSLYTGKQLTNIPIHEIQMDGVSIPIGLDYQSGGIRVNEIASSVGLGWNLSVGGQITRVIKGKPDEESYLSTDKTVENYIYLHNNLTYGEVGDNPQIQDYHNNITYGSLDVEPDEFHYNFGGVSGKFVFNQIRDSNNPYGEVVMLPETDVMITPIVDSKIIGWQVLDTNGNMYIFGPISWADKFSDGAGEFLESTQSVSIEADSYTYLGVFTTWNLKKIITSNNRLIEFEYVTDDFYTASFNGESKMISPTSYQNQSQYHTKSYNSSYGKRSRLVKISTNKEQVNFNYGTREDLSSGYKLENIEVKDIHGNLVNKVVLDYSYFVSDDSNKNGFIYSNSFPFMQITDLELQRRLKLESVDFYGKNPNSESMQTYTMEYNEEFQFPNRYSFAQDSWGFYNGQNSNSSFLPSVYYNGGSQTMFFKGSNRKVYSNYKKTGMLTKLIYPTGGFTTFEYESNELLVPYTELIGLESIFGIEQPYKSTFVTNEEKYMDRRRYNPNTQLYEYTYVTDFTITSDIKNNGLVTYKPSSSITGYPSSPVYNVRFQILKREGTGFELIYTDDLIGDGSFNLLPGEYQLKLFIEATYYDDINDFAKVKLEWENNTFENIIIEIGGLRIKEISHYNQDSVLPENLRRYEYPLYLSTGFMQIPNFVEEVKVFTSENSCSSVDGVKLLSHSIFPLLNSQEVVGYKEVIEKLINPITDIVLYENIYNYSLNNSYSERRKFNNFLPMINEWVSGNLRSVKLGESEKHSYVYSPLLNPNPLNYPERKAFGVAVGQFPRKQDLIKPKLFSCTYDVILPKYTYTSGFNLLKTKSTIRYDGGTEIKLVQNYLYDTNSLQPTQIETVYDTLNSKIEEFWYSGTNQSFSELEEPIRSELSSKNIKRMVKRVEKIGDTKLVTNVTKQKKWSNNIILSESIKTSKGTLPLEDRVVYHGYFFNGNVKEVSMADGTSIVYIWGYNEEYPIAKIENATFLQVESAITTLPLVYDTLEKIQAQSNSDNDRTIDVIDANGAVISKVGKEGNLREALRYLRDAMPYAMFTTYTYDPLVGVTSVTDYRGYTVYYEYDDFNRLKLVKDAFGKILSQNDYHYKGHQ